MYSKFPKTVVFYYNYSENFECQEAKLKKFPKLLLFEDGIDD